MSDAILIRRLSSLARIGCTAEERAYPQRLEIDCEVSTDLSPAGTSGSLEDTVCYMQLREMILALGAEKEWVLLEELGEAICGQIFAQFPRAESVKLEIHKFVISDGEWVGLRLLRRGSN